MVLAGLCLFVLPSCTDANDALRDDLAAARATWQSQGIASYDAGQEWLCECTPPFAWVAHVRQGRIERVSVDAEQLATDEPDVVVAEAMERAFTVEGAFDVIEEWIGDADGIEVTYHASLGYPTSIRIDKNERMMDEEIFWRIVDLRVVAPGGE
jgi:hypothetical protein